MKTQPEQQPAGLEQLASAAVEKLDPSKSANDSETARRIKIFLDFGQQVQERRQSNIASLIFWLQAEAEKQAIAPTSGKQEQWDEKYIDERLGRDASWPQIIAAANYSITAERQKYVEQREDWIREIQELREQLADRHKICVDYETKWKAEREKSRVLGNMVDGLREQLAKREQSERGWIVAASKLQTKLATAQAAMPALAKVKEK